MRFIIYICLASLIGLLFFTCKKDKGLANLGNYPNEVGKILVNKCASSGCHNDQSFEAASRLNLSTWESLFKGSRSGSSVIPYRSDFSPLCYFINSYTELGPVSAPAMPANGTSLSKEEVSIIKNWIDNGAPDIYGNIKWAENPQRKKAYVVNQGCDVVTVFDSETQLPIRYITVGANPGVVEVPHMVKISPDGEYWYVVFLGTNILQKFRCSDDVLVGQCSLGASLDWNTVIISNNGKRAYCVAWTSNGHVASVDVENMRLIHNYGGFNFPHGVALNKTNDTIYVTAQSGNFIFQIDTAFNGSDQISIDPGFLPSSSSKLDAHEIILSPTKDDFYITCQKTNEIRVYNIASKQVTHIISTGYYPQEMAIAYGLNKLYVSCPYDSISVPGTQGGITEINLADYTAKKLTVGFMPHGIGVDEKKSILYVASRNIYTNGPAPHHTSVCNGRNGFVNFVDLKNFTVLPKRTEISVDPYGVGVRN